MTVIMSSKGQIVVPKDIRDRAGIEPGDHLEISLTDGAVQLKRVNEPSRRELKIKVNPATGFPYFDVPKEAPTVTDVWVKQQLADFP